MTDLLAQRAHRDYVSSVLFYYAENDIRPGDPNEGIWDDAHYPVPKCLGGTETIWLLREHHAVQGVLQSEEYRTPCVAWWERAYLSEELLKMCNKWMAAQRVNNIRKAWDMANSNFEIKKEWTTNIAEGTRREWYMTPTAPEQYRTVPHGAAQYRTAPHGSVYRTVRFRIVANLEI